MKIKYFFLVILTAIAEFCTRAQQQEKGTIQGYLSSLPEKKQPVNPVLSEYLMTTEYYNTDIYGNYIGNVIVSGKYTCGLENGYARWNEVYIAKNDKNGGDDSWKKQKQEYIENMVYKPSGKMLDDDAFTGFPEDLDGVFAGNLIWDMYAIEIMAWKYYDSLKLNMLLCTVQRYWK